MRSVFASRRRAEEFHSLVEAPRPGAPLPGRDASTEEFLAIVASLRAVPAPDPRPEFVASLREELLSAADTLLVPASDDRLTLPPRNTRRDRRVAAAIAGIAVVGAGTSMAVAAQSALPGEMLYPLKRAMEDAQVGAASGSQAEARALLDSASSRLSELQALDREGELAEESAAVSTGFVDFGTQADRAADIILADHAETGERGLVRELRDFTGASMTTLQELETAVPPSARDELLAAVEVISAIDTRALQACPSCGGQGITQVPPALLSSAATQSRVVVIPGATVKVSRPRDGGRRTGNDGDDRGVSTRSPLPTNPLATGGTGGGTVDAPDSGTTGPLGDLSDTLTGGGDPPASNDGGLDVGGVDVGGVDVDGALEDTLDKTGKTLDETGKKLGETVDELGDTLLGD